MNENGVQKPKTLQEKLEELKLEQAEAERIYRGRMQLGALNHDPASVQVLAQTILDRKMQIEELEAQIAQNEQPTKEEVEEKEQPREETALTEYHNNPILNWLQRQINKLEKVIERLEQMSSKKDRGMPKAPKGLRNKWEQYQDIVDTDFSKNNQPHQKKSWELDPEQLEEIRRGQVEIAQKYNQRNGQVQSTEQSKISSR